MTPPDRDPTAEAAPLMQTKHPKSTAGKQLLADVREPLVYGVSDRVPAPGYALAWWIQAGIVAIEAEAGALDAAWRRAEAALPGTVNPNIATTWSLSLVRDIDHPYYRAQAWEFDDTEPKEESEWVDSPAAALIALAERLEAHRG